MHQYTATDASSAIYAGRLPFPVSRQPGPAGPQPKGKPMTGTSLQHFINRIRAVWGPLSSALVAECRHHLEALTQAPETEPWLAALHETQPASRALYRDQIGRAAGWERVGPYE